MPARTRAISTLPRVDYEDAFLLETARARQQTAEQWIRGLLDDAPESVRRSLRTGWLALGFRLAPGDDERSVLGWEVRRSTPDRVLLGLNSRIGMPAELVLERRADALLFGTLVQQQNPFARLLWAAITPGHQRVVLRVFESARRRIDRRGAAG
jgi:hypothetical protein